MIWIDLGQPLVETIKGDVDGKDRADIQAFAGLNYTTVHIRDLLTFFENEGFLGSDDASIGQQSKNVVVYGGGFHGAPGRFNWHNFGGLVELNIVIPYEDNTERVSTWRSVGIAPEDGNIISVIEILESSSIQQGSLGVVRLRARYERDLKGTQQYIPNRRRRCTVPSGTSYTHTANEAEG